MANMLLHWCCEVRIYLRRKKEGAVFLKSLLSIRANIFAYPNFFSMFFGYAHYLISGRAPTSIARNKGATQELRPAAGGTGERAESSARREKSRAATCGFTSTARNNERWRDWQRRSLGTRWHTGVGVRLQCGNERSATRRSPRATISCPW